MYLHGISFTPTDVKGITQSQQEAVIAKLESLGLCVETIKPVPVKPVNDVYRDVYRGMY
jgi:hypothetical protein